MIADVTIQCRLALVVVLQVCSIAAFASDPLFKAPLSIAVPNNPDWVAFSDFNENETMDLVVVGSRDSSVTVLTNDGHGMLTVSASYRTAENPTSVAISDLDGDGHSDLIVGHEAFAAPGKLAVLMGHGDGTFAPATYYEFGWWTSPVAVGDLDLDGDYDLVVSDYYGNRVFVLENSGDGTFLTPVSYSPGTGPYYISVADLNVDAVPDLAVSNFGSDSVAVMLNNGDGTFGAPVHQPTGHYPRGIVAADIDGDADADLAVAGGGLYINDGEGGFDSLVAVSLSGQTVQASDLDQDGDQDLVVASFNWDPGGVTIFDNDGLGQFGAGRTYNAGTRSFAVAVANMNGDSHPDLVVTDTLTASVYVLLNDSHSGYPRIAGFGTGDYSYPRAIYGADLNGNDMVDLVTTDSYCECVSISFNTGNATFQTAVDYGVGEDPRSLAGADIDLDGDIDLVTANAGSSDLSVLINIGGGIFDDERRYSTGYRPRYVIAGDLNDDLFSDLAVISFDYDYVTVMLNNGDGTFTAGRDFASGTHDRSIVAADLNGDGLNDLAVPNAGVDSVSVLINLGGGTFANPVNYLVGDYPYFLAAADFNSDGYIDLATANLHSDDASVILNRGDGTFMAAAHYPAQEAPRSLVAADFNGDKFEDLALANSASNSVSVLVNDKSGGFALERSYWSGRLPYSLVAADLDGDTVKDIASANYRSWTVSILVNTALPVSGVDDYEYDPALPDGFALSQNFPNPFNPSTRIEFELPRRQRVRLDIYNILGRKVANVVDRELPAGAHRIVWNGLDDSRSRLASGVYFYQLTTASFTASRKMILLK